ncbi:LuxR C-terminal-related transcriptional regulator [Streptomyces reniochalinae]|uniref:LuxR family transcriptional regulator n=1 Tax=Streptomyces reniochalinae TaxID=2250578 RepID=A0A367EIL3_9ACTN|nr:LuxR family transcriptional regulator [Streptomyces reniochalinae]RCG17552.1 LuxR family transcriptional regulator [Streptomyces reniochalinae]
MSAGSRQARDTVLAPADSPLKSLLQIADTLSSLERYATETADQLLLSEGDAEVPGRIRHIEGQDVVQAAIGDVLWRAKREILTAQPDEPRTEATLDMVHAAVRDPLARGVAMRTLFQHSARFSEPAKRYVQQVMGHREVEVRTLPEFFERLIIVDAEVAFIAGARHPHSAALIRDGVVVAFLAGVYERAWVRAEQFPFRPVRAADAAREVIPDVRRAITALLIEGRSDKAIARRLGISLRSVQGHIASLREQYGAQHRFQLGYLMARGEHSVAHTALVEPPAEPPPTVRVPARGETF